MIKYIGSKRKLLPAIRQIVSSIPEVNTVIDFFAGTSRVGHCLKAAGYQVIANDLMTYAYVLATCYVEADLEDVERDAKDLLRELGALEGSPGYFTETYCEKSRFFQPKNGARVDAIRERIEDLALPDPLRSVVLTSLVEAADRVDSTTGLQMAYLKQWAPRAFNDLELRMPQVLPSARNGRCRSHQFEAFDAARRLAGDLAYIDPPYNQHSYLGNYHIWESLVCWDKPEVYGVACKRIDCRTRKSSFNSRTRAAAAFAEFVACVRAPFMLVSFSNEGYIAREEMERILGGHGDVHVIEKDYKRYVGAQIGIYNPSGERVGAVSHLANKEYLYLVVPTGYKWSGAQVSPAQPEPLLFG